MLAQLDWVISAPLIEASSGVWLATHPATAIVIAAAALIITVVTASVPRGAAVLRSGFGETVARIRPVRDAPRPPASGHPGSGTADARAPGAGAPALPSSR